MFNFSKNKNFRKHINNSIPGYDTLLNLLSNIVVYYYRDNQSKILDCGSSDGYIPFYLSKKGVKNIIAIDKDTNFNKYYYNVVKGDVTNIDSIPGGHNTYDIILFIFLLQFIPTDKKILVLKNIFSKLKYGGYFILSEKLYPNTSDHERMFSVVLHKIKEKVFTPEDILTKDYQLGGHLTSLCIDDLKKILTDIGFSYIEIFFKSLNFTGIICQKQII